MDVGGEGMALFLTRLKMRGLNICFLSITWTLLRVLAILWSNPN